MAMTMHSREREREHDMPLWDETESFTRNAK